MSLSKRRSEITNHPENKGFLEKDWQPLYTAHAKARIVIIGQAPGEKAQTSKIPWNDPSGDNLRSWLNISEDVFYDETKISLLPMDFYYPGKGKSGDLPPRPDFASIWHPQILKHMSHVKLTLLIGTYAQNYYLKDRVEDNLTKTVRNYRKYLPDFLPLIHPSPRNNIWQKKNPWFKEDILPFLGETVGEILRQKIA